MGGRLETFARSGGTASVALLAALAVLKLAGCLGGAGPGVPPGQASASATAERGGPHRGLFLALYGGVLTLVGALGLFGRSAHRPDVAALYWHVLLWDPWFLLWAALLTITALRRFRLDRRGRPTRPR